MQIETVGKYQIHLIAHELPDGRWDPFVAVFKFDDKSQDFKCVQEKQRANDGPCTTYADAIDAARRTGATILPAKTR